MTTKNNVGLTKPMSNQLYQVITNAYHIVMGIIFLSLFVNVTVMSYAKSKTLNKGKTP